VAAGRHRAVVLGFNRGALALARGLGRAGIPAAGVGFDPFLAYRSRYFTQRHVVASRPGQGRPDMQGALERLAGDGSRLALLPGTDGTVVWIADHWQEIRAFADAALPEDVDVVRRLVRKDLLPEEGERAGIASPRTLRPASADEIRTSGLRPPLIVKGLEGKSFILRFGKKLFTADTIDEAVEGWERARLHGVPTIIQELVPSHDGNVFSYFGYVGRDGRALASVVGLKVREAPRPFGSSTVFVAQWNDRVYELGLGLLQSSGFRGFGHVELAYDDRIDDYVLIEVNARVPTWAGIAMGRHLNIAEVAYRDLCGLHQEPVELRAPRVWVDFIEDLKAGAPRTPAELRAFGAPYLRRGSVGALFAPDDPRPALTEVGRIVGSKLRIRTRLRLAVKRLVQPVTSKA
jgi:predicted ATP-grasp superfamily ATP-dependent carboligase